MASTYPAESNAPASARATLVADGSWKHYAIDLTELVTQRGWTSLHRVLEDRAGLGSIPGDVFFDHMQLVRVDEEPFDLGIFNQLVPCTGPAPGKRWKNHGQYVSTMVKTVEPFLTADIITEAELVISTAARSRCGKKQASPMRLNAGRA
ncbi:MAG: hypothetical protein ACK45B_06440 [Limisphaerales bacterium]